MKHFSILTLIALAGLTIACSKKTSPSATVNYLSGDDGTVSMRCIGIGKSAEEAKIQAEINCFHVILFRGLPGSVQKIPMIGTDESLIMKEYEDYFDSFFKEKRYRSFLMSSVPATPSVRLKKKNTSLTLDTKINLVSLRRDLESHGVIRKFGL